jgi:RNase P subunit RPR2
MTAVVANRNQLDGVVVEVQAPNYEKEELAYLEMTSRENYEHLEQVRERIIELMHYQKNRLAYRKRTEMAVEIVQTLEAEGQFSDAAYAFDNGVLSRPLTQLIEAADKVWVSEIERSRHILWQGTWQRADAVEQQLRTEHPESFRRYAVQCRNGETKLIWAFSKTIRLKKYGRKRLVIVHEQEDLQDAPRFLLTNALHWESSRIMQTWSYRWPVEIFHEFAKQITGFESAQLRNEEAVKRHFCLSCVAQSILQRVLGQGGKSERFKFAETAQTVGQQLYTLSREALGALLEWAESFWKQGQSVTQLLEVLMPV